MHAVPAAVSNFYHTFLLRLAWSELLHLAPAPAVTAELVFCSRLEIKVALWTLGFLTANLYIYWSIKSILIDNNHADIPVLL